uniref:Uncharacterized protein n=1 Tax=Pararge aegeria TaxID=116150 RepID=S4P7J5_9NEOP
MSARVSSCNIVVSSALICAIGALKRYDANVFTPKFTHKGIHLKTLIKELLCYSIFRGSILSPNNCTATPSAKLNCSNTYNYDDEFNYYF